MSDSIYLVILLSIPVAVFTFFGIISMSFFYKFLVKNHGYYETDKYIWTRTAKGNTGAVEK